MITYTCMDVQLCTSMQDIFMRDANCLDDQRGQLGRLSRVGPGDSIQVPAWAMHVVAHRRRLRSAYCSMAHAAGPEIWSGSGAALCDAIVDACRRPSTCCL